MMEVKALHAYALQKDWQLIHYPTNFANCEILNYRQRQLLYVRGTSLPSWPFMTLEW
jgi:hypothetical protein